MVDPGTLDGSGAPSDAGWRFCPQSACDEDGGYIADIPDLEACSAFGTTPEEALAEVNKAKEAWLEVARESGQPIPVPRYRPLIYQIAS